MLRERSFRFSCMSPKRSAAPTVLDQETCREIVATCACFNFRKASRSVTQLFDQILAPIGLRSTQLVILVTCEALGPCGLARLARELVMDRSTVTRNLRPLISQGFLQVTGKSGRAGKSVELTKTGRHALVEAAPYWQEAQGQLLSRLGQERWDRVMADLAIVVDAKRAMA
jgi:DNA-binding MarR family transcriptional regulator